MKKSTTIYQPFNGYVYNSDTIFLYDFITSFSPKGDMLDVGSGSGILGILLSRDNNLALHQSELQDRYAFLSSKNAEINSIKNTLYHFDFLDYSFDKRFDVIVTNPPFYHDSSIKSEDKSLRISRHQESLPLDKLIQKSNSIIKPKGEFYMIYDAKQLGNIFDIFSKYKLNITDIRFIHSKSDKSAKVVMIRALKSSKSLLNVIPALIVHDNGEFSTRAKEIFQIASTYTIKVDI